MRITVKDFSFFNVKEQDELNNIKEMLNRNNILELEMTKSTECSRSMAILIRNFAYSKEYIMSLGVYREEYTNQELSLVKLSLRQKKEK